MQAIKNSELIDCEKIIEKKKTYSINESAFKNMNRFIN